MDIVLDCSCGMAGDMFLAALFDAGLNQDQFASQIKSLLPSEIDFKITRENRCGISAVRFEVCPPKDTQHHHHHHEYDHHHNHTSEHHHRGFTEIKKMILSSDLSEKVKETSVAMFLELAKVEAKAHGTDIESVHFHEVGAIDSIVDIVGAALAVEMLEIDNVYVSEISLGRGHVKAMHGVMPVPAPATSELIKDTSFVFKFGPEDKELLTPTGALILKTFAKKIPTDYSFEILKTGYGGGLLDFETRANVVKVLLCEDTTVADTASSDEVCVLEANIDDMPPFYTENIMEKLFSVGALDVFFSDIKMKKNRNAILLSVICEVKGRKEIEDIIFQESTSIGVRYYFCSRTVLKRESFTVSTKYGDVSVKKATKDDRVCNVMPEYEDCLKLAKKAGVPLKEIYRAVYAVI